MAGPALALNGPGGLQTQTKSTKGSLSLKRLRTAGLRALITNWILL